MESKPETEESNIIPEKSSTTESNRQYTEPSAWCPSLHFHGHGNEVGDTNKTSTALDVTLPVQSCHAHLDLNSNGLSGGDELLTKLSRINGAINKMTQQQLQKNLTEFNLNARGVNEILRKRLKNYYKQKRMAQCNKVLTENERTKFNYLVIIDFEATCCKINENFVHEIIEFPAVMVDVQNQSVCHIFHRFCKPRINPILTDFCTELTGISQSQVDQAKDFTEVIKDFEEWLSLHGLGTEHEFAVLTDGPCDMGKFLKTQVELSKIEYPQWAKQWINLRKVYTAFYASGLVNLNKMLDDLGLKFQGRPHCGLDDASNMAAIVMQLLQDGANIRINEYFQVGDVNAASHCGPSKASGDSNIQMTFTRSPVKESNSEKLHDSKIHKLAE